MSAATTASRVAKAPADTEPLTDRGRRTRAQLVAAARSMFEQKGYSATTMSDIAAAAGFSHGTVYTYFNDKRDVFRAVVDDLRDQLAVDWRVGREDADPITRIDQGNRNFVNTYGKHIRLFEVVDQAGSDDPEFRQLSVDIRHRYVERSVAGIKRLQAQGKVDQDVDAYLAASALCAMVEGFARRWLIRHEDYDPETIADTLTSLWANALGLKSSQNQ